MKNLFGTLLTMTVSLTVLLAVAIGIGFLLHWILPAIDIGIAVLIAIVACGILIHFMLVMMSSPVEDQDDEGGNKVSEKIYLIEPGSLRPRKRKQPRY